MLTIGATGLQSMVLAVGFSLKLHASIMLATQRLTAPIVGLVRIIRCVSQRYVKSRRVKSSQSAMEKLRSFIKITAFIVTAMLARERNQVSQLSGLVSSPNGRLSSISDLQTRDWRLVGARLYIRGRW